MHAPLFDHRLRAARRDRAFRTGLETFLFDRAFEECRERLDRIRRSFANVLIAGCPNPTWPELMREVGRSVTVIDPGQLLASRAGGFQQDLEALAVSAPSYDLCMSIGLLDTANDLSLAVANVRRSLRKDGLFMGAISGGESLPRLRRAMLAADAVRGRATPHIHPRIEASSLAQLLSSAGFADAVVDIDRVDLSYPSLDSLIRDLRAMAATNILASRARKPLTRKQLKAGREEFLLGDHRAVERIEILHFAAWNPAEN